MPTPCARVPWHAAPQVRHRPALRHRIRHCASGGSGETASGVLAGIRSAQVLAAEQTHGQRRIGDKRQAFPMCDFTETDLGNAVEQIIGVLDGYDTRRSGCSLRWR